MTALKARVAPPAGAAYAEDFYTWSQEQGARLRAGDLTYLDLENLAEEIESLGRSRFSAFARALRVVLLHMLKFDHQPSRQTCGWAVSIATLRVHAAEELKESTGLKSRIEGAIERAYKVARLEASKEMRLPLKRFAETCPYTYEQIVNRPFAIGSDA